MWQNKKQPVRAGKPVFVDGPVLPDRDETPSAVYSYCMEGSLMVYEGDRENSLARREVYSDGSERFYIKTWTTGLHNGKVLDPWGIYFKDGDERRVTVAGLKQHEYRSVTMQKFNDYVEYLKTRKKLLLNVLNGDRK